MKIKLLILTFLFPLVLSAQEECKVLLKELDSTYIGSCKNGLAHGIGEAWGEFHYIGNFVKGLPHGQGKADFPDGKIYEGKWKKGLRNGQGSLTFIEDGEVVKKTYVWSKGKMVREVVPPAYKVIRQRNINRLRVYSQGGENSVWFYPKSMGGVETIPENMRVTGTNGSEIHLTSKIGYENVTFPFTGSIKYITWNKLRTAKFEVILEIEIFEPGYWIVEIQN
jgi:hypothetical protein